jgi:hypothetical protein
MEMVADNRGDEAVPLLSCEEVEKDVPCEEIGAYAVARAADADLFPQKVRSLHPRSSSAPSRAHCFLALHMPREADACVEVRYHEI